MTDKGRAALLPTPVRICNDFKNRTPNVNYVASEMLTININFVFLNWIRGMMPS